MAVNEDECMRPVMVVQRTVHKTVGVPEMDTLVFR